ncbi:MULTISPECIES: hypothetical protein [unclassified Oleiphilus]|uniref:CC0125/CC1285 family lipoprotein n=3 Tax=Oleiphilus TaxID=141450 RepID=UPI0007C22F04|nr:MULTISPECIES: hypothetical protein [unclassified Oleiphilus]KZY73238.1 hypothetical protein A3740_19455 [Oleiphilus sp. HI0068]KZY80178.1 hypothetical protein A3741_19240 [Oleiphilus sp. HI0069]KZY86954.1 hypothetical protein A3743_15780 [Oleiphilus sp. HI0072]KZZ10840.1 hypothetical protein A3749_10260 [Oleiphilus sp. HI0078]KZZ22479.1 hypothetical protein A3752_06340 [Oleiphilus sp. HI0081]KZZ30541.1 hypothetical protein A3755_01950 [Oleiphilus sp. HI0085]
MQKIRFIAITALSVLLSACAAVYHAAEEGNSGYRDLKAGKGIFYVEYTESANRSWETIHGFALKRCAEIAKENGYKYFDVLSKDEKEVYLESDIDQINVASLGGGAPGSWNIPVSSSYSVEGVKVEGRRVTYKIQLSNQ